MPRLVRGFSLATLGASCVVTLACPAHHDDETGPGASTNAPITSTTTLRPLGGAMTNPLPSDVPGANEALTLAALPADVALAEDPRMNEADPWGVELEWAVRPRFTSPPPADLGAIASAYPTSARDTWRTLLAEGRLSIQLGAPTFVDDHSELRASSGSAGALHVWGAPSSARYRILPAGSLRAFLAEGRADVVPLAPARTVAGEPGTRLGRKTDRATITTSYGTIELEQIAAPTSQRTPIFGDARPPGDASNTTLTLEGAGDPLCRLLLELVAADRVTLGEPCRLDRVPVFADIAYATGGGLTFEATSLHERMVPRSAITFPPAGGALSQALSPFPAAHLLVAADSLIAIRARGEATQLLLLNEAGSARLAILDGVAVAMIPTGEKSTLDLRAASYVLEWRTPIGEIVERGREVSAPGRAIAAQLSPALPDRPESASTIPSARIGP